MRTIRMPRLAVAAVLGLAATLAAPLSAAAAPMAISSVDPSTPAADGAVQGDAYPGDPALESQLVAAEDRRLIDVRAISNAAGWTNVNQGRPYRLVTGNTYTLVLIRREAPYTLDDLLEYAPSTFVRQPDGSYLLTENIVVEQGATLKLESEDGLVLHLASTPDAFVSIVTIGGALLFGGTEDRPMEVTSWDPVSRTVDTETSEGRAYLRVTGGHAAFTHVTFHDLGFWSGTTGGVSLTGTAAPETLSEDADQNRVDNGEAGPQVYGTDIYPAGGAELLDLAPDLGGYSYVSAAIDGVESRDNAFGMFITSAVGIDIRDSTFSNNLVDGLVLHRGVTNTVVHNTTASNNGVDGVSLTRAATGVILDRITAEENGRNGVRLEGGPLADGPSATGTATGDYGNNTVSNSLVNGNGRYGIEVVGGENIVLDGNSVSDHQMGIVVADGVTGVTLTDNIVEHSVEHAIALRGGVTGATVQGNSVDGGTVGVFLRDASGLVDRNVVTGVSNHAVTVIRGTEQSSVTNNIVSGRGPSAIDVARAALDPTVENNDLEGWQGTKPLDVILRSIFQPLTVMWILLGAAVVITALTGLRSRKKSAGIRHPYESHRPLDQLTAGVADPAALGRSRPTPEERPA